MWIKIGKIEDWEFHPNFFLGTNFEIFEKNTIGVSEEVINVIYKWDKLVMDGWWDDGYYQIEYNSIPAGIVKIKNGEMRSLLESRFMRK